MRRSAVCLLLFVVITGASAQITFSVTGTANSTAFGYTSGQSGTFNFTVTAADLSGLSNNQFFNGPSFYNIWREEGTFDTQMYAAVGGTGLTGTFAQPSLDTGDPSSSLATQFTTRLYLTAGSDSSFIGLFAGGYKVTDIVASALDWGQSFPTYGMYQDIPTYFGPYAGTHTLTNGTVTIYLADGSFVPQGSVSFTANSITIGAIPEPSVQALLAGAAMLGFVFVRRRRRTFTSGPT